MKIFPHPIELELSSTGSYESVDLSSTVDGTATGVILEVYNESTTTDFSFAFRETSSTKDLYVKSILLKTGRVKTALKSISEIELKGTNIAIIEPSYP